MENGSAPRLPCNQPSHRGANRDHLAPQSRRRGRGEVDLRGIFGGDSGGANREAGRLRNVEASQLTSSSTTPLSMRLSRNECKRVFGTPDSLATLPLACWFYGQSIPNDTPYGLSGIVTSGDVERARRVAKRIRQRAHQWRPGRFWGMFRRRQAIWQRARVG
jgi:hypothetical protein